MSTLRLPLGGIAPSPSEAGKHAGAAFRAESRSWIALGASALAIAGIFALLLALSRVPRIESVFPWPLGFFNKGLVIHVVFSLVVWFLAIFALFATLAVHELACGKPRLQNLGRSGAGLVAMALPCLFLPAFLDESKATLNNYVPVIVHRAYYFGLVLLAIGVALPAVRLLGNVPRRWTDMPAFPAAIAGCVIIYLVALACFGSALMLSWGAEATRQFHEQLFWGGGHILQFIYASMMLTSWYLLVRTTLGNDAFDPAMLRVAVGLMVVFALPAPLTYQVFDPFSFAQTESFRRLQMAVALPSMIVGMTALLAVREAWRRGALPWKDPAFLALVMSALVFGAGGIMGLLVTGSDTRTPAHYHGVIAGVNLSLMGVLLGTAFPSACRAVGSARSARVQVLLFGFGQLTACIGLFLAGGYGAPRKTPSGTVSLVDGALAGMYLHGIGALLAVIGGIMFVASLFTSLRQSGYASPQGLDEAVWR